MSKSESFRGCLSCLFQGFDKTHESLEKRWFQQFFAEVLGFGKVFAVFAKRFPREG